MENYGAIYVDDIKFIRKIKYALIVYRKKVNVV